MRIFTWVLIVAFVGCTAKKQVKTGARKGASIVVEKPFLADNSFVVSEVSEFYFSLFQTSYLTKWDDLVRWHRGSVAATRVPYTDYWYPERVEKFFPDVEGVFGTNIDGALKLYDDAFYGGKPTAVVWENAFHNGGSDSRDWGWFGHCNGSSTAASRHQNPGPNPVLRPKGCGGAGAPPCVVFEPKHIRALLAEIYMSAKARFISGQRCNIRSSVLLEQEEDPSQHPANRIPADVMDDCVDVNPAGLHLALINWIGVQKEVIVFDFNRDREVWNYPLYKYRIEVLNQGRPLTIRQAMDLIGRTGSRSYVFNTRAQRLFHIRAVITYSRAYSTTIATPQAPTNAKEQTYEYVLEVDEGGHVVGGEWVKDYFQMHPDFIWMPFEPRNPPGTRKYGNRYVDPETVLELWRDSKPFGNLTENPNRILQYPKVGSGWGFVPGYFQLSLDGSTSGSVFLGKPIVLEIDLEKNLQVDGDLTLTLNGQHLTSFRIARKRRLSFTFAPPAGMNSIDFAWRVSGIDTSPINVAMRFIALN